MSETVTRARRSGAETREQILHVAFRLFTEKGFEATTTRDIAAALGMNQSSLYYHFASKDAIVSQLVGERRRDLDAFAAWVTAQPPSPDLLRVAALRWLEATTPEHLQLMRLALVNPTVHERLIGEDLDVRAAFDAVIDHFVDDDTPDEEKVYVRMVFDTASAALLSAYGTGAGPDAVLRAARRATSMLAPKEPEPSDQPH